MTKANTTPIYPGAVLTAQQKVNAANTARDGSGAVVDLLTAGTDGAVVGRVDCVHAGAVAVLSTALVARLWRKNGGTYRLIDEIVLAAATPATSPGVVGAKGTFNRTNIILASGEILGVTMSVAEPVDVCAEYSNY